MRLSHDDQMRQARLQQTVQLTRKHADAAPVRLAERTLSQRPIGQSGNEDETSVKKARVMGLTPRPQQQARIVNARGAMKVFLAHARTVQNLPGFAKRMRE
jgi:hypothetical protein